MRNLNFFLENVKKDEPRYTGAYNVDPPLSSHIAIPDKRKIRATTGKPLQPNHRRSVTVRRDVINDAIMYARKYGVNPDEFLALLNVETNFNTGYNNPGHVLDSGNDNPESNEQINGIEIAAKVFKNKLNYAKRLGFTDHIKQLQAYNGYGVLKNNTEPDYYGHNNRAFYGVEIPKGGSISMKKTPLYGIELNQIAKENISSNESIQDAIQRTDNKSKEMYSPIIKKKPKLTYGVSGLEAAGILNYANQNASAGQIYQNDLNTAQANVNQAQTVGSSLIQEQQLNLQNKALAAQKTSDTTANTVAGVVSVVNPIVGSGIALGHQVGNAITKEDQYGVNKSNDTTNVIAGIFDPTTGHIRGAQDAFSGEKGGIWRGLGANLNPVAGYAYYAKKDREEQKRIEAQKAAELAAAKKREGEILFAQYGEGRGTSGTYGSGAFYGAYGGTAKKPILAFGTSGIVPLANNAGMVVGPSHEAGGVETPNAELEGGEVINGKDVYSNRIETPNGQMIAQKAAELVKLKGNLEKSLQTPDLSKKAKERIIVKINQVNVTMQQLLDYQEAVKDKHNIPDPTAQSPNGSMPTIAAYGGRLPKLGLGAEDYTDIASGVLPVVSALGANMMLNKYKAPIRTPDVRPVIIDKRSFAPEKFEIESAGGRSTATLKNSISNPNLLVSGLGAIQSGVIKGKNELASVVADSDYKTDVANATNVMETDKFNRQVNVVENKSYQDYLREKLAGKTGILANLGGQYTNLLTDAATRRQNTKNALLYSTAFGNDETSRDATYNHMKLSGVKGRQLRDFVISSNDPFLIERFNNEYPNLTIPPQK